MGGFNFICKADFIGISRFHSCLSKDFINTNKLKHQMKARKVQYMFEVL